MNRREQLEDLRIVSEPLVRWMQENCDLHQLVIVSQNRACLVSEELGVPFPVVLGGPRREPTEREPVVEV